MKMTNDLLNQLSCSPVCFLNISHPAITANSCFFFSIFSFFLYPAHVGFFHFLSSALFPSSETMVKDNIYRKPPIYKQHGTVHFVLNASLSGLVSARCVACCPSVMSFIPVLLLYVLRTALV